MNGQSFKTTVRQQFNIFLGALMFMTRLPVGKGYVFRSEDLPRSAVYFPIVGRDDWFAGWAGALVRRAVLPAGGRGAFLHGCDRAAHRSAS